MNPERIPDTPEHDGGSRRIGGFMIAGAWILFLGLLWLAFGDYLERQFNPNRQVQGQASATGSGEITLRQNRSGHYVASGTINGRSAVFMLDTGATQTAVPQSVADDLGLTKGGQTRIRTANGTTLGYQTVLRELALGPLVFRNVSALVAPNMGGDQVLIGMNLLRSLELIQRDRELTLRLH